LWLEKPSKTKKDLYEKEGRSGEGAEKGVDLMIMGTLQNGKK